MQITVDRYSIEKKLIKTGQLQVVDGKDHITVLTYYDSDIKASASELYHPLLALENLRKQLEVDFNSIIAINGCRIDTSYRPTGTYRTYIIEPYKQAIKLVSLFEPTTAIDKLCCVKDHKQAYKMWLESLDYNSGNIS